MRRRVMHSHSHDEERRIRERALDETLIGTFPASDPPSSLPNPDDDSVDTDSVSNEPDDVGRRPTVTTDVDACHILTRRPVFINARGAFDAACCFLSIGAGVKRQQKE